MKFFLTFVQIFLFASITISAELLKVSVYYESLCPYCIQFITKQLYPGYKQINSSLYIDLVPYGNAKQNNTNGSWTFQCQHGPEECFGNKVHACALSEQKNQNLIMDFVNCMEQQTYPGREEAVVACAPNLEVTSSSILSCARGQKGDVLLAYYGDRTKLINYLIPGVPSIFFNEEYNSVTSNAATEDFLGTACKVLLKKPSNCPTERTQILTNNVD